MKQKKPTELQFTLLPLGVSLSPLIAEAFSFLSSIPELLSTHNIYSIIWKWQLFENSPWLSDIKSDFSKAECLARGMAADGRTMQQAWY